MALILMLLSLSLLYSAVSFSIETDSLDFLWLLMVLIFIRMGVGTLFFQTEMSLLPSLLAK